MGRRSTLAVWGHSAVALAMAVGLSRPAAAGPDEADVASMFDVAFGIGVTNDYVSRGISQTGGKAAVQGYVEATYGIAYAGIWASNVDFGSADAEIDLSVGIRPETDAAAFDLGYVQYVYANGTSPSYGELYGIVEYYATDALTLGGDVYFAPDYSQEGASAVFVEATVDYALPNDFGVSGAVGHQSFDSSLAHPDYWTWNAGVYWTWNELLTVDLRYTDSDLSRAECAEMMARRACGSRFMATVSLDTAWSTLTGN